MNMEVRCRHCRTAYVLDGAFAGSALPCPACGTPDGLSVPAAPRSAPRAALETRAARPAAVAARPHPAGPTRRVQPAVAAAPAAAPAAAAVPLPAPAPKVDEPEEVVCPRCKLHFTPRRAASEVPVAARPIVLVVEDMEYFRQAAAETLGTRFEVRQASTVREARAQLSAGAIDLMVLDLTLDGGDDGIDLLRGLPGKPCPILIYTDQESAMYGDIWEELQRLGADDILMKGMNAGEALLRKVSGLLGLPWDEDE